MDRLRVDARLVPRNKSRMSRGNYFVGIRSKEFPLIVVETKMRIWEIRCWHARQPIMPCALHYDGKYIRRFFIAQRTIARERLQCFPNHGPGAFVHVSQPFTFHQPSTLTISAGVMTVSSNSAPGALTSPPGAAFCT